MKLTTNLRSFERIAERYKLAYSRIKVRLGIKGRARDLLNPIAILSTLTIKHKKTVKISNSSMRTATYLLPHPEKFKEDVMLASEIWRPILYGKIEQIAKQIDESNFEKLTDIYENLFKSHLMDGAVSHSKDIPYLTKISTKTRFYRWKKVIKKQLANTNKNVRENIEKCIYSDNYNYGRPLVGTIKKNQINIECLDEVYFALEISKILQSTNIEEIVFIGDGAGLLAPLIIEINNSVNSNKANRYIIIDFAHFALATILRIREKLRKNIEVMSPSQLEKTENNDEEVKGLPFCEGTRLIINQDSFPEMNKSSLYAYITPKAHATYIASYNQNILSKVHNDHIKIMKDCKYKQVSKIKSKMRRNYSILVFKETKSYKKE